MICGDPTESNDVFQYSMFEDTISNLMMPITVVNDTAVQNKEVFLADKDSCLIGQKWILEESIPDNEIKFLENPCNVPGGCPLCAGDCDSDSDCAEGLRCLQRRLQRVSEGHIVIGRENVPGCHWKAPNDPERFLKYVFCKYRSDLFRSDEGENILRLLGPKSNSTGTTKIKCM